ncbi:MAG TPA: DEAD/DEAH box helicase, partial [Longimicrobiales bacterium]|nr:DEAD/DEAH box helicase [Longimicrobiales bacterium]
MSTFEDLEISPELIESLAAEGIETPSALQRDLIPVVRRGNNVVVVAGPGAGILAACTVPLLERVPAEGDSPGILILTPTAERAAGLADSMGRLALATGHRVAALDSFWVLPERAHVLVGTPESVQARISGGHLSLEAVEAVVVDGAASMAAAGSLERAGSILEGVKAEAQRLVVALPASPAVEAFAERHARKSVHVPSGAAGAASPHRGDLTVMESPEVREDSALRAVAHLLQEARHVLAFVRSEDAAADLGDFLSLRGYMAGRPGDGEVPVWLAVSGLEARQEMEEGTGDANDVAVLSVDVPPDADALDQRHGSGRGGVVLALPRELPHVRAVASEAGYVVTLAPLPDPRRTPSGLAALLASLEEAAASEDVEAYQALLEPLFNKHGTAAVAAAAVALLRTRQATAPAAPVGPDQVQGFVRLFISVGKMDNVRPGDLVGAIAGEAGVDAARLGRIELRDTYSLVEVEPGIAEKIIKALNGTSIRGRAARVDYHREDRRGERPGAGDRRPGPRTGGP